MTCLCVKISTTKLKSGARIGLIYLANTHRWRACVCVCIPHRWDAMYTNLCDLQRGAAAASPRITHISKHKRPSPCQPWRCGCGWLRKTRILLSFFLFFFPPPEIKADVNRACLGVCEPLRAIKAPQVPGRRSR